MLMDGPWDMHIVSYDTHGGFFPVELRVASGDEALSVDAEDFHAGVYRRGEVEKMPAGRMFYANYTFVGMKPSKHTLVDVWVT